MITIDTDFSNNGGDTNTVTETVTPSVPLQSEQVIEQPAAPVQQGETFAATFDPNKITDPNLQAAYKSMQADYTKKMQEIAGVKQKAEQFSKYEQYAPVLDQMLDLSKQGGGQQQAQTTPELERMVSELKEAGYSDEAIDMMKIGAGFILNHLNQKETVAAEQNRIVGGIQEAGKIDPRLNDESLVYQIDEGENLTYGQIVEQYVAADPNWRADPVGATRHAIKMVDSLINKAKSEGKEELSKQATVKAKQFAPAPNSSPQTASETAQPLTIKESYEMSKKQLGIA